MSYWKLKRHLKNYYNQIRTILHPRKQKVFCIGRNKTGTTSLKKAMTDLGYIAGNQRTAELLFDDWSNRDFRKIIQYCNTAQFFQDVPFSLPETYKELDKTYPGSRFILTIRDSPDQWYNSITQFHAKLWGKEGKTPTKEDLQEATYIYKGRPWHTNQIIYSAPPDDPYKKEILVKSYINYNQEVKDYFRDRPGDLLVLNLAEKDAHKKLCSFLDLTVIDKNFPWENKT